MKKISKFKIIAAALGVLSGTASMAQAQLVGATTAGDDIVTIAGDYATSGAANEDGGDGNDILRALAGTYLIDFSVGPIVNFDRFELLTGANVTMFDSIAWDGLFLGQSAFPPVIDLATGSSLFQNGSDIYGATILTPAVAIGIAQGATYAIDGWSWTEGQVTNNGRFELGNPANTLGNYGLRVNGELKENNVSFASFTQSATGTFAIDVNVTGAGLRTEALNVEGDINLGGQLEIRTNLLNTAALPVGDVVTFLWSTPSDYNPLITGNFANNTVAIAGTMKEFVVVDGRNATAFLATTNVTAGNDVIVGGYDIYNADVGQTVTGQGIAPGTTVIAVNAATRELTLSNAATETITTTLRFSNLGGFTPQTMGVAVIPVLYGTLTGLTPNGGSLAAGADLLLGDFRTPEGVQALANSLQSWNLGVAQGAAGSDLGQVNVDLGVIGGKTINDPANPSAENQQAAALALRNQLVGLANNSPAQITAMLNSLDPQIFDQAISGGFRRERVISDMLSAKLSFMRRNEVSQSRGNDSIGASADGSAWADYTGDFSSKSGTADQAGYQYNNQGAVVGYDQMIGSVRVGIYGAFSTGETEFDRDSAKLETDTTQFGVYATKGGDQGFFLAGSLGGGFSDTDSTRNVSLLGTATANYSAVTFHTRVGTGYQLQAGNFRFIPEIALEYAYASVDQFTENGPIGLDILAREEDSINGIVSFRAEGSFDLGGVTLFPDLGVQYVHDFIEHDRMDAQFRNLPITRFTSNNNGQVRDLVRLTTGVNVLLDSGLVFYLRYNLDHTSGNASDVVYHTGQAGLRFNF